MFGANVSVGTSSKDVKKQQMISKFPSKMSKDDFKIFADAITKNCLFNFGFKIYSEEKNFELHTSLCHCPISRAGSR